MNCPETQAWMLHSETPAITPAPAAEHLSRCSQCRGVYQQLMAVEGHLQSAPLPAVPTHVREAIFAGMGPAPVRVVPVKMATVKAVEPPVEPAPIKPRVTTRRRRRRNDQWIGYILAAAASIVIGLLIGYGVGLGGRGNNGKVVEAPRIKPEVSPNKIVGPKEAVANEKRVPNKAPEVVQTPDETPAPAVAVAPESPALVPEVESPNAVAPPKVEKVAADVLLSDEELLTQLVTNHTQVAAGNSASERLKQLDAMAKVLWTQAVKHSPMVASTDRLELMRDAYTGIVEIDLPAIARDLPAEQQSVVSDLVAALEERSSETSNLLAGDAPENANILKQLRDASNKSVQRLQKKSKEGLVRPKHDYRENSLLPIVIEQTVWAAREDNPLERADHSTVLAEAFTNEIILSAKQGNANRATQLGGQYGRILENGIGENLQRLDMSKATYQQQRRYQQVLARTQQTAIMLQRSTNATRNFDERAAFEEALRAGGLPVPQRPMINVPNTPIIIFHWVPGRFGHHHSR
jgi:hypothetical protein